MNAESKKKLEIALDKLKQTIPGLQAVVLFGTFGTEDETAQSDLDLAILSQEKLETVFLWNLAQEIAIKINRDVDLIDLQQASTVFRVQILFSGQAIFCQDKQALAEFDTTSFSMYFDLQETRKEILEDYERGDLRYG